MKSMAKSGKFFQASQSGRVPYLQQNYFYFKCFPNMLSSKQAEEGEKMQLAYPSS